MTLPSDVLDRQYGKFSLSQLVERQSYLRGLHSDTLIERSKIRALMNGGSDAVRVLLGDMVVEELEDLPIPNIAHAAMERHAQKMAAVPIIRGDLTGNHRNERKARESAERRERIVENYDDIAAFDLQLAQMNRWLLGYGYGAWMVAPRRTVDGFVYPNAELRDPWDTYPGWWGPMHEPNEVAFVRKVPLRELIRLYPQHEEWLGRDEDPNSMGWEAGGFLSESAGISFENQSGAGVEVVEYHDYDGMWIFVAAKDAMLDYTPNPLTTGGRFVVPRRITFSRLQGQYTHSLGQMTQFAKQTILEQIAMEDNTFTPTDIVGDLPMDYDYQFGRDAKNILPPGTSVQRNQSSVPAQIGPSLARAERLMRMEMGYSTQLDSESPTSFATGEGIRRLGQSSESMIAEYQKVLARSIQTLDTRRLEMDETMLDHRKPMSLVRDGATDTEWYKPSTAISRNYKTRRVFPALAGLDDPQKLIALLQMDQAGWMDDRTAMEQLGAVDDVEKVLRRRAEDQADEGLQLKLNQQAINEEGPGPATMALVDIKMNPANRDKILVKYFKPEGVEQQTPEEFAASQPTPELPQGPNSITTLMARLNASGTTEQGAQTVQTVQPPGGVR